MTKTSSIRYLSGVTNAGLEAVARERSIGLLVQPGNSYHLRVGKFDAWAGDNGAFSKKGGFCPVKFRRMIRRPELRAAAASCLFIAAPDVLHVQPDGAVFGDAQATLDQFTCWAVEISNLGYPVALVAQDGLEFLLDSVSWDLVDVLFLGGSTEWKLSEGARRCVERAKREGKRVHMGRVNSYKRLALAQSWGVDTADGTFLGFGPTKNLPRLCGWLDKINGSTAAPSKKAA